MPCRGIIIAGVVMPDKEVIFGGAERGLDETRSAARHEEIAALAYQYWMQRGCPFGSPEVDWNRAEQELQAGTRSVAMAEALISRTLSR